MVKPRVQCVFNRVKMAKTWDERTSAWLLQRGMGGEICALSLLLCCDSAMGLDQVQTADATVTS